MRHGSFYIEEELKNNIIYAYSWFGERLQTPNQSTTSVMKQRRR
jgi:hypothetical protein